MQSESRITQQELASLFPDGVPMPIMKMIFPEKSEKLTVDDIRYILNAMRSEAALSTDAEPVGMDDEDRTPTPAGFDDALWRKADEVHHAIALVARDQECVKIIYAALSTHNAEPVKTAPAVAVKALEWRDEPVPPSGETLAPSVVGLYCIPHSGDRFYLRFRDAITLGDYSTLDKAKAAAQADYDARILSALSAQVQDVAGWQPINTAPQDGDKFLFIEESGRIQVGRMDSEWGEEKSVFVCLTGSARDWYPSVKPTHWMPLPASPASKHGDAE